MRSAVFSAAAFALIVLVLVVAAVPLASSAVDIDMAHWQGNPLPPCLFSAAHCGGHVLGTDEDGRDLLARIVVGARNSIGISSAGALGAALIGSGLGMFARRWPAIARHPLEWLSGGLGAFAMWPLLVTLLAIIGSSHEQGLQWATLAMAFALVSWPPVADVIADGAKLEAIVDRALGVFVRILLVAALIDFLRYGVFPPDPTLGNMLANAESNMETAWWAMLFPALTFAILVLLVETARRGLRYLSRPSTSSG